MHEVKAGPLGVQLSKFMGGDVEKRAPESPEVQ